MSLTVGVDSFKGDLAAQRPPQAFVGPLGHAVSPDAPSGLVRGLTTTVARTAEAWSPPSQAPSPQTSSSIRFPRPDSPMARFAPAAAVQREAAPAAPSPLLTAPSSGLPALLIPAALPDPPAGTTDPGQAALQEPPGAPPAGRPDAALVGGEDPAVLGPPAAGHAPPPAPVAGAPPAPGPHRPAVQRSSPQEAPPAPDPHRPAAQRSSPQEAAPAPDPHRPAVQRSSPQEAPPADTPAGPGTDAAAPASPASPARPDAPILGALLQPPRKLGLGPPLQHPPGPAGGRPEPPHVTEPHGAGFAVQRRTHFPQPGGPAAPAGTYDSPPGDASAGKGAEPPVESPSDAGAAAPPSDRAGGERAPSEEGAGLPQTDRAGEPPPSEAVSAAPPSDQAGEAPPDGPAAPDRAAPLVGERPLGGAVPPPDPAPRPDSTPLHATPPARPPAAALGAEPSTTPGAQAPDGSPRRDEALAAARWEATAAGAARAEAGAGEIQAAAGAGAEAGAGEIQAPGAARAEAGAGEIQAAAGARAEAGAGEAPATQAPVSESPPTPEHTSAGAEALPLVGDRALGPTLTGGAGRGPAARQGPGPSGPVQRHAATHTFPSPPQLRGPTQGAAHPAALPAPSQPPTGPAARALRLPPHPGSRPAGMDAAGSPAHLDDRPGLAADAGTDRSPSVAAEIQRAAAPLVGEHPLSPLTAGVPEPESAGWPPGQTVEPAPDEWAPPAPSGRQGAGLASATGLVHGGAARGPAGSAPRRQVQPASLPPERRARPGVPPAPRTPRPGTPVPALPTLSARPVERRVQRTPEDVPSGLRHQVERAVGADLSEVRVQRGERAASASARLGARAFTEQGEVHLPDRHGPLDSAPARPLLAHELAHVAQQRHLGPALPPEDSPQGRRLELQAKAVEQRFADPAAAALSAGIADLAPDGSIVFRRPASDEAAPPPSPEAAAGPQAHPSPPVAAMTRTVQRAVEKDAGAEPGVGEELDLDEFARRLYPKLRPYLRRELWVERERAGTLTDLTT